MTSLPRPATFEAPSLPPKRPVAPEGIPGVMITVDGAVVSAGVVVLSGDDGGAWRATLRGLDQPGKVASAYFGQGLREVVLRLEDGRQARARIAGTSFIVGDERVCLLDGLEPLA